MPGIERSREIDGSQRSLIARGRLLIAVAAVLVSGLVWGAGRAQLRMAASARQREIVVHDLLTSMLDQETGVRGYLLTREEPFLEPYRTGLRRYRRALARA